jgi:diguanylate cyclase (GGDEF)-like protein
MMELLLWRWSAAVQVSSTLMITLFFIVLAQSIKRAELRPWVGAWVANLAALLITILFWTLQPQSSVVVTLLRALYIFFKTLFVVLMFIGAARFAGFKPIRALYGRATLVIALFALICAFALGSIHQLGILQSAVIAIGLAACAILLARTRPPAWAWLATALALRATFAAVEVFAYAMQDDDASILMRTFLASHSSFDTAAEWMIALGCVLMLYRTIQLELTRMVSDLHASQAELQTLVDHDPLTGLSNRRSLSVILERSRAEGATLLFFDLNDFKHINDAHGHHIGDECLIRFADTLKAHFRAEDRIVRYAGDEFVVVLPDMPAEEILRRLDRIRRDLQNVSGSNVPLRFSVGQSQLVAGGDVEAALRDADLAMYRRKHARNG